MRVNPTVAALCGVAVALQAGATRAEPRLVCAGDVDGDLASEVAVVDDDGLTLRDGPTLSTAFWHIPVAADAVVAMAGDVDGDGLADLAVGEPGAGDGAIGRVTVVFGQREAGAPRVQALVSEVPGDGFGSGVAGVDLDGDGRSELVVGAPRRVAPGASGWVGIYRGFAADPAAGVAGGVEDLPRDELAGFFALGAEVARVFDVDGDGRGDVLISDRPPEPQSGGAGGAGGAWLMGIGATGLWVAPAAGEAGALAALGDVDGDDLADVTWPFDDGRDVGAALAGAGDVNGDMVGDVIVTREGASAVVLGAAHGQAPKVAWEGGRAHALGDVDGDGFADVGTLGDGAEIAVVHGHAELLGEVATVARTAADSTPVDAPRVAIAGGPDLDGDGREGDLVIGLPEWDGAPGDAEDTGAGFLLRGGTDAGGVGQVVELPTSSFVGDPGDEMGAAVSLGTCMTRPCLLVGSPGFGSDLPDRGGVNTSTNGVAYGGNNGTQADGRLGASVALPGDLDGDGLGDAVFAASGFSPTIALPAAGRVYFGRRYSAIGWERALMVDGDRTGLGLGVVAAVGDLDRDGRADVAIGAPAVGEAWIAHMAADKLSVAIVADPGGAKAERRFGAALAGGDFDGDGLGDLAVGAPGPAGAVGAPVADDGARVEVYLGTASGTMLAAGQRQTLEVGALGGLELVLAAGDFDGDGHADLAVGRPGASEGFAREGAIAVYRGTDGGLAAEAAQRWVGGRADARLGLALAPLDRNHDGRCDLALALLDSARAPVVAVRLGNDGARARPLRLRVTNAFGAPTQAWAYGLRDRVWLALDAGGPGAARRLVEAVVTPVVGGAAVRAVSALRPSREGSSVLLAGLTPATAYRGRARLVFPASESPLQPTTVWLRPNAWLPPGADVRTGPNHAPVAIDDGYRVGAEPMRIRLDWLMADDYDVDRDPLVLDAVSAPSEGALRLDGDALVFTPPDGEPREVTFTYRLRDPYGAVSRDATVTLAVVACDVAQCRDGVATGTLALPNGAIAGFSCRVRYDVEPAYIECPVDADGELLMGSRSCAPEPD